ncbi:hypothetical protein [Sediminibacterium sp.]|uniref:hypothetical protein n=1 Tax=Sediminibacterium sp. TaxID=1917865 RepID=UPI003F6F898E
MNINIKELVSNPFFCPFNIDSYNYLYGCKEGKILLYKLYLLYDEISYSFSSPGNSFQRNVIYELNRPFNYGSPVDGCLFNSINNNTILLERYNSIFEGLYNLLNNHQFRQLDHSILEKISSEYAITITSDWLTIEGLSKTLDTFENIQDDLRDRIKLETKRV